MPELHECVSQMKSNSKAWKVYEETEEDKKTYKPKEKLKHQNIVIHRQKGDEESKKDIV